MGAFFKEIKTYFVMAGPVALRNQFGLKQIFGIALIFPITWSLLDLMTGSKTLTFFDSFIFFSTGILCLLIFWLGQQYHLRRNSAISAFVHGYSYVLGFVLMIFLSDLYRGMPLLGSESIAKLAALGVLVGLIYLILWRSGLDKA